MNAGDNVGVMCVLPGIAQDGVSAGVQRSAGRRDAVGAQVRVPDPGSVHHHLRRAQYHRPGLQPAGGAGSHQSGGL